MDPLQRLFKYALSPYSEIALTMIGMPWSEIVFLICLKVYLAYLKNGKMDYLITLTWNKPVNRLSSRTKFLSRPDQKKKKGLQQIIG